MLFLLSRLGVSQELAKILSPILGILAIVLLGLSIFWGGEFHERGKWKSKIAVYEQRLKDQAAENTRQIKHMGEQHQRMLADLQSQLDAERERKNQILTVIKKVKVYVTEKADSSCTITAGAVWVSNLPLKPEAPGVSDSPPGDVDAPTSLKLSDATATIASNYAECVERGQIINLWQTWYARTKTQWEDYVHSLPAAPEVPQ